MERGVWVNEVEVFGYMGIAVIRGPMSTCERGEKFGQLLQLLRKMCHTYLS